MSLSHGPTAFNGLRPEKLADVGGGAGGRFPAIPLPSAALSPFLTHAGGPHAINPITLGRGIPRPNSLSPSGKTDPMRIIAIDFETANTSPASMCAAALAVFDDGVLTESLYWLIRTQPYQHLGQIDFCRTTCNDVTQIIRVVV
jgi:hypothetical protein